MSSMKGNEHFIDMDTKSGVKGYLKMLDQQLDQLTEMLTEVKKNKKELTGKMGDTNDWRNKNRFSFDDRIKIHQSLAKQELDIIKERTSIISKIMDVMSKVLKENSEEDLEGFNINDVILKLEEHGFTIKKNK